MASYYLCPAEAVAMNLYERARAKVNLHLEVLNARSDGYHNLLSVMASVDLSDLLKLDECSITHGIPGDCDITIIPDGGIYRPLLVTIPVENNLITRAIRAYLKKIGRSAKVVVRVEKNIPAGGGLGGGSSDAAAILRLIDGIGAQIGTAELRSIAATVGADVPFCIEGGYALCEGIGERIEPVEMNDEYCVLLVNNGIHVDTASAYRMIDESREKKCIQCDVEAQKKDLRKALCLSMKEFGKIAKNDFENSVFEIYPSIAELKKDITEYGAVFAIMTGSGSTVVGIFDNAVKAENARRHMSDKGFLTVLTAFAKPSIY
jgi:4-diphosphocytidyl-2-C-methyl-D-erythritol kinase